MLYRPVLSPLPSRVLKSSRRSNLDRSRIFQETRCEAGFWNVILLAEGLRASREVCFLHQVEIQGLGKMATRQKAALFPNNERPLLFGC